MTIRTILDLAAMLAVCIVLMNFPEFIVHILFVGSLVGYGLCKLRA